MREVLAPGSDPSIDASGEPGPSPDRTFSIVTPRAAGSSTRGPGRSASAVVPWGFPRRPIGRPGLDWGDAPDGRPLQIPLLPVPEADRRPGLEVRQGREMPDLRRRADRAVARIRAALG